MLDLLLGSACLFLPPQAQAGVVASSFVLGALGRRRRKKAAIKVDEERSVHPQEGVTLSWSDVTCRLGRKDGSERILLDKLEGEARPGRVMAIFGPSGSGMFLFIREILQIKPQSRIFLQGRQHC